LNLYFPKRFLRIFLFINALACLFSHTNAQTQTLIFEDFLEEELVDKLVEKYKPISVLNYANAKDLMYGTIYKENDSVSCVYTGHTVYLPPDVDPSTFLYMNGSSNGINAEHTYPRSKGASDGNAYSDMHHLFPTRSPVNSARNNFPFGEINDNQTNSWFYLNNEEDGIPSANIDLYSEVIEGKFEPREDHKGNVARAVFYFYSMYEKEALDADSDFFESMRQTLCKWHEQDPVDSLEWERTYLIANYQDDLPNPFILDSTLVRRAYCGELISNIEEDKKAKTIVYPNPIIDNVIVTSIGKSRLQVMDIKGDIIVELEFFDSTEIDLSFLASGNYFILLNGDVKKVVKY